ncbi:hypothetical protein [Arenimonas sp. MALMAid1274]|uniref:hypothetical protein n=1 Tax=Arenimonas sp. MALMAid1274 TaxID=3411630 RepID=UPI003B9F6007
MNIPAAAPLKHSGLGIASTVMALLFGLGIIIVFAYAGYLGTQAPGGVIDETDPKIMMVGILVVAGIGGLLLGALLGLLGLFIGERRRMYAWLGLVLNALPLLAALGLMALGFAMS